MGDYYLVYTISLVKPMYIPLLFPTGTTGKETGKPIRPTLTFLTLATWLTAAYAYINILSFYAFDYISWIEYTPPPPWRTTGRLTDRKSSPSNPTTES